MRSKYNIAALSSDKPLDLTAKKSPSTEAQPSVEAKPNGEGPLPDIQMVNFGSVRDFQEAPYPNINDHAPTANPIGTH